MGKGIEGVKKPQWVIRQAARDMSVGGLSLHSTARAETTAPHS